MAKELPDFMYSAIAAASLASKQYYFVKLDSNGKVDAVAAAGVDHDGIVQNAPASGQAAEVMHSGISKVIVGTGGSTRGSKAAIASDGRAILATTDESVGVFLDTVAAGEVASILIERRKSGRLYFGGSGYRETALSGNDTLTTASERFQRIDPNGGARDVILPAEADSQGLAFLITNTADAAENLVIKDDGAATIVTLNQNESAWVVCNGTVWKHMGVMTIAQS